MRGEGEIRRRLFSPTVLGLFLAAPFFQAVPRTGPLEVGYALLEVEEGAALVASALFSYRNSQALLVAEAGVAAEEPVRQGRIFVDQSASKTGLALANPSSQPAELSLSLRDQEGALVAEQTLQLSAGHHLPRFVEQLFPGLPRAFMGTLTFATAPNGPPVAAVTLRQALNGHREPLLATLPVVPLQNDSPAGGPGGELIFPHLGAGAGGGVRLTTQIVLVNPSGELIEGRLRLRDSGGRPLSVRTNTGEVGSEFQYRLAPHGSWSRTLSSGGAPVQGFAIATGETGPLPGGTAIFQFRDDGGELVSEAGVGSALPTSRARIFVDTDSTRTGLALSNTGDVEAEVSYQLLDRFGFLLRQTTRRLGGGQHASLFVDEIFRGLPPGFTGILEIGSAVPLALVTLKLSSNSRRDLILTTLPVADLDRPRPAGLLALPQIGFGQGFSTRLILLNGKDDTAISGRLAFFRSDGRPLTAPLLGAEASVFEIRLAAGAAQQLRLGSRALPASILIDIFGSSDSEITVNRGSTERLHPLVVDSEGAFRDDFTVSLRSADGQVATVDETGTIAGVREGFSTLVFSAGTAVATATITVVDVNRGGSPVDVLGIAGDSSGRIFLASASRHVVLLAEGVQETPQVYAGGDGRAGLRNQSRLDSRFNVPSFLAFNQGDGSLYVSDAANHVIRRILPGVLDRVETFAGSGGAGSLDGAALEGSFRIPMGLALDGRGHLWIADSGNHTIRRLDLVSGQISTVAGLAGSPGFRDGQGSEARFVEPSGLALEAEPLLVQLDRELRGLPPPPVSIIAVDSGNGVLRRVWEDGRVETLVVTPPAGATGAVQPRLRLDGIRDAIVDAVGNIYTSGEGGVQVVLPNGAVVSAAQPGSLLGSTGLAEGMNGRILVADAMGASELIYGAPSITSIEPPAIGNQGGRILVRGRNFSQDTLAVVAAQIVDGVEIIDTLQLAIDLPPLPSGVVTLSLQNRGGIAQAPLFIRPTPLSDLPAGQITTVAGGTTFIGDGGLATEASLFTPQGLAIDSSGRLYVADSDHFRVRRIDLKSGLIVTVAGSGEEGIAPPPDGALATTANLRSPEKLAIDGAGNLFISGFSESAIRRVDSSGGQIRAALPIFGFHEIAADGAGNLYFSEYFDHQVRRLNPRTGSIELVAGNGSSGFSGDGGPAVEASLALPAGLAVDSGGNLFIVEDDNQRVRRVDAATGIITSVSPRLAEGQGVAVDGSGNIFVGGFGGRLIEIEAQSGAVREIGIYQDTRHLAADASGNLYLSDPEANLVLRVDPSTGEARPVAGTGNEPDRGDGREAAAAILIEPAGLAFDQQGNLLVADSMDQRIRLIRAADQTIRTIAGTGRIGNIQPPDGIPALQASLFFPEHVAVDSLGNVFFADSTIWRIDPTTGRMTMLVPVADVEGFTLDPDGNPVFSNLSDQVVRLRLPGRSLEVVAGGGTPGFAGDGGSAAAASLWVPQGVAYDRDGNLYIADLFNFRIRRVDALTGIITTVAGGGSRLGVDNVPATDVDLFPPLDVALDQDGNLFILEPFAVRRVDAATGLISTVARSRGFDFAGDNGPALGAGFQVSQIEIGPDGNLYLADGRSHRVRAVKLR